MSTTQQFTQTMKTESKDAVKAAKETRSSIGKKSSKDQMQGSSSSVKKRVVSIDREVHNRQTHSMGGRLVTSGQEVNQ